MSGLYAADASATESEIIDLFEYTGTYTLTSPPIDQPFLRFQVPHAIRYGSTKEASRAWRIQLLTYYPDFSDSENPKNKSLGLECAGDCGGRIFIGIEYLSRLLRTESPNMGDFIARARIKYYRTPPYPPNVIVRDLDPLGVFSEGFERTTMVPSALAGETARIANVESVHFRKSNDGLHYDLVAICETNSARTTCILHFSLACSPAIYISVLSASPNLLDNSSDIVRKTNDFISPMLKTPACKL
jgi:hypothetical protein